MTRRHGPRDRVSADPAWDFVAALPDPTVVVGSSGRVIAGNAEAARLFGYRRNELIGLPLRALVPKRHRARHAVLHATYRARPAGRRMGAGLELAGLRKDGTEFPAEISLVRMKRAGATAFIAAVRDLTERGAAERALSEERRRYVDRLVSAQDEERRRIARELHDEAGQALATMIVRLRSLQDARSLGEAKAHATRLRQGLADTIVDLGRLARGLHPSMLDDLGLAPALGRYAADVAEKLGIPVRVRTSGLGSRRLPLPVETALFRIAQEALTNVTRHARARRVDIALTRSRTAVDLVVKDDGRGFDGAAKRPRSLGLLGIRERAAALAGTAAIESSPGRGTVVAVALPLPARRAARRTR